VKPPGNTFKYENRLAKSVVTRGGMSASEALTAATRAVEEIREPTIAEIDANLAEIYALGEELKAGGAFEETALQKMYICSNRVVAMGGVFGLGELGQAAYSLCELVSRFQTLERFQWSMIQVHLDGLRLLRNPGEHAAVIREQVLAGLRQVATSVN
jgi:hypothetical protein